MKHNLLQQRPCGQTYLEEGGKSIPIMMKYQNKTTKSETRPSENRTVQN